MIKFTIATVSYNAEKEIARTLDSVLRQDYAHIEHIIIDGASKDGTMRLVNEYEEKTKAAAKTIEIRVLSEPDRGLYDAMNKAIGMATGDYIVFLNAGDKLPEADTLSTIAKQAQSTPHPGVLYGDTDEVDDGGRFLRHRRLAPPDKLSWRSFKRGMLVCHQAFYARVDLAKQTPYNLGYRFSADVDWCIRVMKRCEKNGSPLVRVPAVVVHYLAGGMTEKNHRASLRERFRVMRAHYGLFTTLAMHAWFVVRSVLKPAK